MAKAVKSAVKVFVVTFAVVTGLAALGVAFGVGTLGTFFGATIVEIAAMSAVGVLVGGLLSKGVDAVAENFGSKISTRSATNPRQIIYGQARVGGTITHIETSGTDNHKLSMIVTLAGHELESLDEVLINDISVTSTSVGLFQYATNTKFKNTDNDNKFDSNGTLLRYKFIDGSQTTADSSVTANTSLTSSDKFIDVAYVFIEMVFDSEAFGGGIPPMSFVVKGKKVFDPRDSNQTFGTESTYTWSDNPALCVLDYITNTTYGLKATADEINTSTALGSFKVAANTCEFDGNTITTATVNGAVSGTQVTLDFSNSLTLIDVGQLVTGTGIVGTVKVASRDGNVIKLSSAQTIADGTTLTIKEKSYTANGITNMSADGGGVIEGLLSSCAGKLSYIDGKFVMFAGATVTPDMTITDDNLLAPITVQTRQTSGETFNQVKSVYVDANNNYVATDSPLETTINPATSNTFLSEDTPTGEAQANYKKSLEIQLPFTDTTTMAQRLQRTALLHTRQKTALSVVCNIAYMQLQPFDWVYLTNDRLGYTNKVFEVLSTNLEILDKDGVQVLATRINLKEINNSVYTFASSSYTNPLDEGSSVSTGSFSVSPPTSLAVATTLEITGYDLNVSWTNNPDDLVQGTEVFYGTSSGTYTGSFIVGKGTAKESINGVKASTTYYIAVRHFSANNVFSALTSEVTVTTGTAPISYSTGGGNVGTSDTLNILGANLVLNDFNSTTGGDDSANYTFLNSGNGALGGVTSYQNSDTERIQFEFGEDPDGDWGKDFFTFDFDWGLAKGGADGNSMGVGKFHIKGRAADNGNGNSWLENTIATFEVKNADGNVTTPFVTLANTTITGSTTTPIIEVSQGSAPSTTTNRLYNVGGSLYWNGAVVDTGAGDITGVTINTSSGSLTGGASFSSGDATFTLDIGGTIRGSKSFEDDVVIEGNLDVQGTTTTIDTTNLDVKDKNITLNYGTGDTSANANGAGITIQDAVSATENATILWNTSADAFKFSHKIRLDDNIQAQFGNGADLQIYHDGTTSYIQNNNGNITLVNHQDDGDIKFFSDDGSGGIAEYFRLDGGNGYLITSKHNQHLDNVKSMYGGSNDLQIYHDGTNSHIREQGTGDLLISASDKVIIRDTTDGAQIAVFDTDGAASLNYGNSTKFATTSSGVDINGTIVGDGLTIQGTTNLNGSVKASVNSSSTGLGNHVSSIRINNTDSTVNNWSALVFDSNSGASAEVSARFIDHTNNYADLYLITRGTGGYTTKLNIGSDGDVDIVSGDLQLGGQTVISSARNITAGTIDSGAIDATGAITSSSALTGNRVNITDSIAPYIVFTEGSSTVHMGLDNGNFWIRQNGLGGGDEIKINSDGTLVVNHNSTFNGNITVTGTVDGRDIATDGTKLDGIEAGATTDQTQAEINALGITAIGLSGTPDITVGTINSGAIDVTGTVTSDGLVLGDNDKAKFGDSSDLEIYHDGSASYIVEQGEGSLIIRGGLNTYIQNTNGVTMAAFGIGGTAQLRYNGGTKLVTNNTGIDITGTATMDGLTVDGDATIKGGSDVSNTGATLQLESTETQAVGSGASISFKGDDGTGAQRVLSVIKGSKTNATSGDFSGGLDFFTRVTAEVNARKRLAIASNGDISFYDDTGASENLKWDASADTLNFVDNAKATFGASNDLDIWHSGTNSFIQHLGTGDLYIRNLSDDKSILLQSDNGSGGLATYININGYSGTVTLSHYGSQKLITNSAGIDVTGTVTADGLTVDGGSSDINIVFDDDSVTNRYKFTTGGNSLDSFFDVNSGSSRASHIRTISGSVSFDITSGFSRNDINFSNADLFIKRSGTKALEVDHSTGDISFYDDTGTTQGLFWDSSGETLAIGHTSPSSTYRLDIAGSIRSFGNAPSLTLREDDASNQTWLMASYGGTFAVRDTTVSGTAYPFQIEAATPSNTLYLDSTGKIGIATTNPSQKLSVSDGMHVTPASAFSADTSGTYTLAVGANSGGKSAIFDQTIVVEGSVGIGTSSPSQDLEILNGVSGSGIRLAATSTAYWDIERDSTSGHLTFTDDGAGTVLTVGQDGNVGIGAAPSTHTLEVWRSGGDHLLLGRAGVGTYELGVSTDNALTFEDGGSERARIDSSGNLLVSTTTNPVSSSSVTGLYYEADNYLAVATAGVTSYFNRQGSDGDITHFRKDGSTVGSISSYSGSYLAVGNNTSGLAFIDAGSPHSIRPHNLTTNTSSDDVLDLGTSSTRFKNLYLSGTARSNTVSINGTTVIDSSRNLTNIASISVAPDTNVASTFGRAKFSSLVNDYMYLSHIDHASTTNYAINQNSAGATSINAPSGQSVALKINNVAKITLNSLGNANFAGDVTVTNELNVGQLITASGGITTDQSGQMISGFTTIRVGDALIGQDVATLTTTATTQTNRILASATTYRTLKVIVQIKSSTNFHATEILLTHNGTTVYMTEYATIFSNTSLATFDADISGGNIRLLIDPNQSASTEFKFNVSGIEA